MSTNSAAVNSAIHDLDYPKVSGHSFKIKVKQAAFAVLLILGALLLPVVAVYTKTHIETRSALASVYSEVTKAESFGTPNTSDFLQQVKDKEASISPISSFQQLYSLQADAANLTQTIQQKTLNYQQDNFRNKIDLFKTTLSNTETLPIPSYSIMKNVYLDFSGKQVISMKVDDLKNQTGVLQFYQTQLENELDEAKLNLLYSGLQDSKQEAENIRSFLTARGDYPQEQAKINEYLAKVEATIALKSNKSVQATELQKKIEEEIYPLLETPKSTKKTIEEQEANRLKDLANQENARRAEIGLAAAPPVPLNDDGVVEEKTIYISIARQEVFLYERGNVVKSGFTVTGKPGFETVTGNYRIYAKQRNAVLRSPFEGIEYEVPVSYWMPFYSGYGLHDAGWRPLSTFGGNTYRWNGSHGCANLPVYLAAYIWDWAPVGTFVHVD